MQLAFELNYDSSELTGFSLNLEQVKVSEPVTAYESVANLSVEDSIAPAALNPTIHLLSDYINGLQDILLEAAHFNEPVQLACDLFSATSAQLEQEVNKSIDVSLMINTTDHLLEDLLPNQINE